jgi:hypothetical protein
MIILAQLTNLLSPDGFYSVSTCAELIALTTDYSIPLHGVHTRYPACALPSSNSTLVIVPARWDKERPEEIASVLGLTFGVSAWIALLLHVIVVEWYLNSTLGKEEDQRLRKFSESRRKAAGLT